MKSAEERVNEYLIENVEAWNNKQERALILMVKEQDKVTRHACAETMALRFPIDDPEDFEFAINAIINVKAC